MRFTPTRPVDRLYSLPVAVMVPMSLGWLALLTAPVCAQASHPQTGGTSPTAEQSPFIGNINHNRIGNPQAAQEADTRSMDAVNRGEALIKVGDLNAAISAFQEALSYNPQNGLAYQRLAEAQTASSDLKGAAATYRTLLYKSPGKTWSNSQNGDPIVHMHFTLVLLQLGLRDEALTVYQRGYQLLQAEEAPTALSPARGPLPAAIVSPNFTPTQMEASAATVIAIHTYDWGSHAQSADDFQRAITIQADLAAPYFYLGQIYKNKPVHAADAVAAFRRAAQLGGPEIKPFVDKAVSEGSCEFKEAFQKAQTGTTP